MWIGMPLTNCVWWIKNERFLLPSGDFFTHFWRKVGSLSTSAGDSRVPQRCAETPWCGPGYPRSILKLFGRLPRSLLFSECVKTDNNCNDFNTCAYPMHERSILRRGLINQVPSGALRSPRCAQEAAWELSGHIEKPIYIPHKMNLWVP